jgi:hypothetical protein
MKPPHDLGKHDAKRFRRWLVVPGQPAPACPRIGASDERKVRFGFRRPREPRKIAERDARPVDARDGTDTFVRAFRLFLFNFSPRWRALQILSADISGPGERTPEYCTHETAPIHNLELKMEMPVMAAPELPA